MGLDPQTPECMLNMAASPGYSNIHFFLVDTPQDIKCAPINQTVAAGNLNYINPNAITEQKHWAPCDAFLFVVVLQLKHLAEPIRIKTAIIFNWLKVK